MAMVKDELTGIEYDDKIGPNDEQKRAMEEAMPLEKFVCKSGSNN